MKNRKIFFRNNGLSPNALVSAFFRKPGPLPDWPQFRDRTVIFTHLGRIGNLLVCRIWNLQKGDEVLVPSYNCGSEIDPFIWYGLKPVMYKVDSTMRIDIKDLESRINSKTRLIYVTHYFGWPQRLDTIAKLSKEHNCYLMEDCALALFSDSEGNPVGKYGDASIYSFRKTLPAPEGAALVMREKINLPDIKWEMPPMKIIIREMIPYLARWLIHSSSAVPGFSSLFNSIDNNQSQNPISEQTGAVDMPPDYYFDAGIQTWTISRVSQNIVTQTDREKIITRRRANYEFLYNHLQGIPDITIPTGPLEKGVCPLAMPVLVPDSVKSHWLNALNRKGIGATTWWIGFHRKLDWTVFPDARYLKEKLIVLPVHHYCSLGDMEYIAQTMHKLHGFLKGSNI